MLLLYNETRNKIKKKLNSSNKNNYRLHSYKNESFNSKENKATKGLISNSKTINYEKLNSCFIPKKIEELKDITNFINVQRNKIKENNKKNLIKNNSNKRQNQYSYTFQNFYNNYPQPEPFPKKIDIRIINHNNDTNNIKSIDSNSIYKTRNDKADYDDKKILFILTNLGLENLYSKFKDNFITYNDLNFLTKDDFIEMKIPIGPRNRIIHFIEEFNKIEKQLDFQELKLFIDEYKKAISGKSFYNKKNRLNSNSLFLKDKEEYFKKVNYSEIPNNIKKTEKIFSPNNLHNSQYSSVNDKIKIFKSNYSIDDKEISEYKNNNKKKNKIKYNDNNNTSLDNEFNKTNFTYNDESINYPSKIYGNKNDSKTPKNRVKNFYFKKPNKLKRNYSFNIYNGAKNVKNANKKNNKTNQRNLSKTLINKLDIINKEVEKYEINYKKLKNETKRRNKHVQKILSNNIFYHKSSNYLNYKENNSKNSHSNSYIICHTNNNDLEEEKERNIHIELNK
jgi:hypothetical protein